jgi:hypothetical protein
MMDLSFEMAASAPGEVGALVDVVIRSRPGATSKRNNRELQGSRRLKRRANEL